MNRLNELLGTRLPIIQGGMANIATGEFAAVCSNAGALGVIAAGGVRTAQEAQARAHDEATNALARVQAEARRLRDDVVRAEAARDEVRRRAEADVAKLQGELEKARAVAARAEQTERARRRAEDPLADVGSLKDLLDLTDKAPRRAK